MAKSICNICQKQYGFFGGSSMKGVCITCYYTELDKSRYQGTAQDNGTEKVDSKKVGFETSDNSAYQSNYDTAIVISRIIVYIGWFVVAVGIIVATIGIIAAFIYFVFPENQDGSISYFSIIYGFAVTISGLFLVVGAQVTRAIIDNADNTREMLKIIKNKLND